MFVWHRNFEHTQRIGSVKNKKCKNSCKFDVFTDDMRTNFSVDTRANVRNVSSVFASTVRLCTVDLVVFWIFKEKENTQHSVRLSLWIGADAISEVFLKLSIILSDNLSLAPQIHSSYIICVTKRMENWMHPWFDLNPIVCYSGSRMNGIFLEDCWTKS